MEAPPVLTAERIDAMLSIMAEVCLEAVVETGQRQKSAEDIEAFERCGRSLQRACRNLRQTIAMKQRHDREQARKAEDACRVAQDVRKEIQRARNEAITIRRAQVRRHFDRVLWDEYEPDEVEDMLDVVHTRLGDMVLDDDFLEAPLETLIQRLADEIGLGEQPADDPPDPPPEPAPLKTARPRDGGDPSRPSAGAVGPPHGSPPARGRAEDGPQPDGPAAAAPPRPPPDTPPEPYIPPWEQLRPGQRMPGGSGW